MIRTMRPAVRRLSIASATTSRGVGVQAAEPLVDEQALDIDGTGGTVDLLALLESQSHGRQEVSAPDSVSARRCSEALSCDHEERVLLELKA